jgi:hypothetical protein
MKTLNPHLASQATNSGVKFSKWGIHWVQPTLMISLYLLSVGAALSHHLFYTYLDERPAFHQERYIRIGTAISLLSRIFLASSVTVALAQRSWSTVQNKSLSLAAVDDLFMTPFGITKVFNWELLRKAKVSIALSILVFVAPVITVVTPRSLIVENSTITRSSTLPLPNIDLSRNETLLNDQDLLKIVKFEAIDYVVFKDMSGGVGSPQYDGPASRAISLIYQAAYGGEIVYGASPCGANCQYHQSFVGPSYRCFELDQYDTSAPWCVEGAKSDISCESVIDTGVDPLKTQTYEARNSSELFIDKYGGPLWTDGEDEWMDGIIWIRHRYLPLEWRGTLPDDMSYPPPSAWKNFTSRCEQWHTRFDVQRVWLDSEGGIGYNTTYVTHFNVTLYTKT